jgi:hypothetical protein
VSFVNHSQQSSLGEQFQGSHLKADLGRAFQARYNGSLEVALEAALDRLLAIMQGSGFSARV